MNDLMELIKNACDEDSLAQLYELYTTVIKARLAPVDEEAAKMLNEALDIIIHAMSDRAKGIGPKEHRNSRTALFQGITTLWENAFLYGDDPVYVANELKKHGLENLQPYKEMDNEADRELFKEYFDFITGAWAKSVYHGQQIESDVATWRKELIKSGRIEPDEDNA